MFESPVQDLIDELGRLPGVGPKSAHRKPQEPHVLGRAVRAIRFDKVWFTYDGPNNPRCAGVGAENRVTGFDQHHSAGQPSGARPEPAQRDRSAWLSDLPT